jgi:hypothetical protein
VSPVRDRRSLHTVQLPGYSEYSPRYFRRWLQRYILPWFKTDHVTARHCWG